MKPRYTDPYYLYQCLLTKRWKVKTCETLDNGFVSITIELLANSNCKNTYLLTPIDLKNRPMLPSVRRIP